MASGIFYPTSNIAQTALGGMTNFIEPGANTITAGGFTAPENAYASDNVYATAVLTNHQIRAHLWMFDNQLRDAIPAGSQIVSAKLVVEKKYSTASSGGGCSIAAFSDRTDGAPSGMIGSQQNDAGANGENTSDANLELNFSPTASQLRNTGFCVSVIFARNSLTGYTASIDMVRLEVTWNPPGGQRGKPSIGPAIAPAVNSSILSPILPPRSGVISGRRRT
jgi:hypothetical protein